MIPFSKYQALSNDFIILSLLEKNILISKELVQKWGDRKRGVGFDQLLILAPPSKDFVDFDYNIYNQDGTQAFQCGNGARALAKFVWKKGYSKMPTLSFLLHERILKAEAQEDFVRVSMGEPSFLQEKSYFFRGEKLLGHSVFLGNPHLVLERHELDEQFLFSFGSFMNQNHQDFPKGVNVSFVQKNGETSIDILTYERGAMITESCGSGAAASFASLVSKGRIPFGKGLVRTKGGNLWVEYTPKQSALVFQKGPAVHVFDGFLENEDAKTP